MPRQCNYTAHATNQRTRLCRGFSCDCTRSAAHDTRPTQAGIIPLAPRWRAHTRRTCSADTRYHRHAGTLYRSAQPPIIIRYIRGQTMPAAAGQLLPSVDPLASDTPGAPADGSASPPAQGQPGGVSILPTPGGLQSGTGSAVRAGVLAPSTRRGSPAARERGGRRGTIGGFRRISFRAFAR